MKLIKNTSLQAFTIYLNGDNGCVEKWLPPGQGVVVPDNWISEQVITMSNKRLLKVTNA
jgi:hypothetical protein